jgi:hypothetical protein
MEIEATQLNRKVAKLTSPDDPVVRVSRYLNDKEMKQILMAMLAMKITTGFVIDLPFSLVIGV